MKVKKFIYLISSSPYISQTNPSFQLKRSSFLFLIIYSYLSMFFLQISFVSCILHGKINFFFFFKEKKLLRPSPFPPSPPSLPHASTKQPHLHLTLQPLMISSHSRFGQQIISTVGLLERSLSFSCVTN